MRDALKSFYFRKKKSMQEKEFSFYFIQLSTKRFFYERISVENLYESQFCRFRDQNVVYLTFKFVLNRNWLVDDFS